MRYSKDHEWVRFEDGLAVCGISDYAQHALGDVVFVELPVLGRKVKAGEQVAVVESVKAASEVYTPIDGEVVAVNQDLENDPAAVNSAAETTAWFFKLKPVDPEQVDGLMDAAAYRAHTSGQG